MLYSTIFTGTDGRNPPEKCAKWAPEGWPAGGAPSVAAYPPLLRLRGEPGGGSGASTPRRDVSTYPGSSLAPPGRHPYSGQPLRGRALWVVPRGGWTSRVHPPPTLHRRHFRHSGGWGEVGQGENQGDPMHDITAAESAKMSTHSLEFDWRLYGARDMGTPGPRPSQGRAGGEGTTPPQHLHLHPSSPMRLV